MVFQSFIKVEDVQFEVVNNELVLENSILSHLYISRVILVSMGLLGIEQLREPLAHGEYLDGLIFER